MASSEGGKPRGRGKKTPAVAGSKRQKKARASAADTEEDLREQDGDAYLPAKMTKRILEQAREQRDEMEEEEEGGGGEGGGGTKKKSGGGGLAADQVRFATFFFSLCLSCCFFLFLPLFAFVRLMILVCSYVPAHVY